MQHKAMQGTNEDIDEHDDDGEDGLSIHSDWKTMKCGTNIMQMFILVMKHE